MGLWNCWCFRNSWGVISYAFEVDSPSKFQQAKQNEVRKLFSLNVAATGSISGLWYLDLEKEVVVNIKPPFGEYVHIFSKHRTSKSKCFPHSCFNSQVWRFNVYITSPKTNKCPLKSCHFRMKIVFQTPNHEFQWTWAGFWGGIAFPLRKKVVNLSHIIRMIYLPTFGWFLWQM